MNQNTNPVKKTDASKAVTASTKIHVRKLSQGTKVTVAGRSLKCLPTDQSSR
jgi:hypothetical protein